MLQVAALGFLPFDACPLFQNCLSSSEVDAGWRGISKALMIPMMIVVADEYSG